MRTTTLTAIKAHAPCRTGWETLLKGLGKTRADDAPLPYTEALAAERGFQVWLESVGKNRPGFVIEDGRVTARNAEEAA